MSTDQVLGDLVKNIFASIPAKEEKHLPTAHESVMVVIISLLKRMKSQIESKNTREEKVECFVEEISYLNNLGLLLAEHNKSNCSPALISLLKEALSVFGEIGPLLSK